MALFTHVFKHVKSEGYLLRFFFYIFLYCTLFASFFFSFSSLSKRVESNIKFLLFFCFSLRAFCSFWSSIWNWDLSWNFTEKFGHLRNIIRKLCRFGSYSILAIKTKEKLVIWYREEISHFPVLIILRKSKDSSIRKMLMLLILILIFKIFHVTAFSMHISTCMSPSIESISNEWKLYTENRINCLFNLLIKN